MFQDALGDRCRVKKLPVLHPDIPPAMLDGFSTEFIAGFLRDRLAERLVNLQAAGSDNSDQSIEPAA